MFVYCCHMQHPHHLFGNHNLKLSGCIYAQVRAAFVARSTSLARWCAENGVKRQYAAAALKGERTGPKARALRMRIISAAGVHDAHAA